MLVHRCKHWCTRTREFVGSSIEKKEELDRLCCERERVTEAGDRGRMEGKRLRERPRI